MRSMVEAYSTLGEAPPPPCGRSPSPAKAGEDLFAVSAALLRQST